MKSGPSQSLSGGQINFDGGSPYGEGKKGVYLGRTTKCGSIEESVNAFGLRDMHGNVWEWCEDRYGAYPKEKVKDYTGPKDGSGRVLRGGSWRRISRDCRAGLRLWSQSLGLDYALGFRLAADPSGVK